MENNFTECNIDNADSKFLASVIVSYRILGLNKKIAQKAMLELASRRSQGENFPFESWIAEQVENFNATKKI